MKNKHTDRILITDQDRRFVVKMSIYLYQKSLHIRFPFKYRSARITRCAAAKSIAPPPTAQTPLPNWLIF